MKFSFEEPFTKFCLDGKNEENGWVELRALSLSKSKEIREKTTKKKFEFKRGQRFEVEEVNGDLRDRLTWDYCIGKWHKVNGDDGKELPNTIEVKLKLMAHSVPFVNFVTDKLEFLSDQQLSHEENSEKNSEASLGQSQNEK